MPTQMSDEFENFCMELNLFLFKPSDVNKISIP